MAKGPTITTIASGYYSRTALNDNFTNIDTAFDNTLSLDGSAPNALGADLDLNNNDILNANNIYAADIIVAGISVSASASASAASAAAALVSEANASTSATAASLSATQAAQYDGIWLDDVAALLADTTLTYTAGQPSTVVVGDYVRTRKEGFAYQVATVGDVTTAGSVQLDVLADGGGVVVPEQFGAVGDNSTDVTTEVQAAITYAVANGVTLKFNKLASGASSLYKISTVLSITGPINIEGHGRGYSGIVCVGCSGFLISAGVNFVNISGIGIFQSVRHTVTPNVYKAIETQGTTGSRNFWHTYDNIFIDGFHTSFFVSYLWSTQITNINTVFGMNGIHSVGLSVNNNVTNCQFGGDSSVGSVGIQLGDGTIATEGWMITDNLIAYFEVGVWGYGCSNCHLTGNIIDFFDKRGVILQSTATAGATNWNISDNYMACSGTGSTGIYLLNNYAAGSAGYRGTVLHGNDILAYSGSTLAFGIAQEGTAETNNSITSNKVNALGGVACKIIAGAGTIVSNNAWKTGVFTALVAGQYLNNTGTNSGVYPHSEGSFTPTITGTSAAGVGTYTAQVGRYKIVDKVVFFSARCTWSAHTGTGNMKVSGLPVASLNLSNYFPAVTVFAEGITFPGATTQIQGAVNTASTTVELRATGNGIGATAVAIDTAGNLNISGFYEIA